MKTISLFLLLSMVTVMSAQAHNHNNRHNNAGVTISIQTFYDELSPYGDWVYTSDYGYVWRPYFEQPDAFRPYSSNGHWVNTDFGWTWVSDYNWGWATFHYGRWSFDNYLGWMWVPGYDWAPAWVTWGNYGDYYGWAPMGPNIYVNNHSNWYAPDPWWTFVPRRHFCATNWNHYIYDRPVQVTNITYITNVYNNNNNYNSNNNSWYYGPRVSEVERYGNTKVRRMEVVDSHRADNTGIRNERLSVYRPEVENNRRDSRPTEFRNAEQARKDRRVQPTNARTNDPGVNRTRENRTEVRNTTLKSDSRNTINRETKVEPRSTTQYQSNRTADVRNDLKSAPRTTSQTEPRTVPSNRGIKAEPRIAAPRQSNQTYTSQPSERNREETSEAMRNPRITERTSSTNSPAKIENRTSRQTSTTTQAREQKSQNPAPSVRNMPSNSETKARVKENVKQASGRVETTKNERTSSANPSRR